MNFRHPFIITLFIILEQSLCAATKNPVPVNPVIYGHYRGQISGQQLQVQFYDYFFQFYTQGNVDKLTCAVSPDGSFKFRLPSVSHPAYFSLVINPGYDEKKLLDLYIVEQNDSIDVDFDKKKVSFLGRGVEKYNCRNALDQMPHDDLQTPNNIGKILFEKPEGNKSYFQLLMQDKNSSDSQLDTRLRQIEAYKSKLSSTIYALIRTDYIGDKYERAFFGMRSGYVASVKTDTSVRDLIDFYRAVYKDWLPDKTKPEILVLSKSYNQAIVAYLKLAVILNINDYHTLVLHYSMLDLYGYIDTHYQGILKERVVTEMMVEMFHYLDDSDEYLEKSLHEVKVHSWWQILEKMAGGMLRGAPVYPILLPDSNNKPVNILAYKGKVVIIDFWYTGCGACRLLASGMKYVVDHYKEDSNVVFLTISIDKDTAKWKKSLRAQSYSGPGEINMYTEGQGYEHPLIHFYDILGYPKVIIIDKNGKIFSTHPKIPWDDNKEANSDFQQAIESAKGS